MKQLMKDDSEGIDFIVAMIIEYSVHKNLVEEYISAP